MEFEDLPVEVLERIMQFALSQAPPPENRDAWDAWYDYATRLRTVSHKVRAAVTPGLVRHLVKAPPRLFYEQPYRRYLLSRLVLDNAQPALYESTPAHPVYKVRSLLDRLDTAAPRELERLAGEVVSAVALDGSAEVVGDRDAVEEEKWMRRYLRCTIVARGNPWLWSKFRRYSMIMWDNHYWTPHAKLAEFAEVAGEPEGTDMGLSRYYLQCSSIAAGRVELFNIKPHWTVSIINLTYHAVACKQWSVLRFLVEERDAEMTPEIVYAVLESGDADAVAWLHARNPERVAVVWNRNRSYLLLPQSLHKLPRIMAAMPSELNMDGVTLLRDIGDDGVEAAMAHGYKLPTSPASAVPLLAQCNARKTLAQRASLYLGANLANAMKRVPKGKRSWVRAALGLPTAKAAKGGQRRKTCSK